MKPLTRKEMLLDGAAKGNLDTFKPATREEVFMKKAIDSKCLPDAIVYEMTSDGAIATCSHAYDETLWAEVMNFKVPVVVKDANGVVFPPIEIANDGSRFMIRFVKYSYDNSDNKFTLTTAYRINHMKSTDTITVIAYTY